MLSSLLVYLLQIVSNSLSSSIQLLIYITYLQNQIKQEKYTMDPMQLQFFKISFKISNVYSGSFKSLTYFLYMDNVYKSIRRLRFQKTKHI